MRGSTNYFLHSEDSPYIIKGELLREDMHPYASNRFIKDNVFRLLMDDEDALLSLFNALEGTKYTQREAIHINTLKGPIFNRRLNDLSYSVEHWYLSLVEHQSTWTENIPVRMLIYLGRVYEQILDMAKTYRVSVYRIPLPRLYMLYNGPEDFPKEVPLRLSDAFWEAMGVPGEMTPSLELVVKAININPKAGHPMLEKCPVLKEYSLFIERIQGKLSAGKDRDTAVKEAIRECVRENILREFLTRHGKEVFNMLFDEITYEDIMRVRIEEAEELATERGMKRGMEKGRKKGMEEGMKQGIEQGLERGIEETTRKIALKMKAKNTPVSEIAEFTGLSEERIAAL